MRKCTNILLLTRMARLQEAKLAAAVYVAVAINKRRKVKRKCWVKNWVRRRDMFGKTLCTVTYIMQCKN